MSNLGYELLDIIALLCQMSYFRYVQLFQIDASMSFLLYLLHYKSDGEYCQSVSCY